MLENILYCSAKSPPRKNKPEQPLKHSLCPPTHPWHNQKVNGGTHFKGKKNGMCTKNTKGLNHIMLMSLQVPSSFKLWTNSCNAPLEHPTDGAQAKKECITLTRSRGKGDGTVKRLPTLPFACKECYMHGTFFSALANNL